MRAEWDIMVASSSYILEAFVKRPFEAYTTFVVIFIHISFGRLL